MKGGYYAIHEHLHLGTGTKRCIKRRMEKGGNALSPGIKKIGEWTDLGGGRGFLLVEGDDPNAAITSTMVWSDLMKMEVVPLVETATLFPNEKGK